MFSSKMTMRLRLIMGFFGIVSLIILVSVISINNINGESGEYHAISWST